MGLAWLAGLSVSAQTWDAKQQFSTTQNPTSVWKYGWSTALSGPITAYPNYLLSAGAGSEEWTDYSIAQDNAPHVSYYPGTTAYQDLPPQSLNIHPGPANQFSHCQWTAPAAGNYKIQASFTALDYGTPHGYLLINGTDMGDSLLPEDIQKSFNFASVALNAGDTVDVVAGVGTDNTYYNDEAAFTFTVTAVAPLPSGAYDAKAQFSSSQNPGGPWSYGWSTNLAGPMTVYPDYLLSAGAGSEEWTDYSIAQDNTPHVSYYPGTTPYQDLPPQSLNIHPGPSNQFSRCRWTAPTSGTYSVQSSFTALDIGVPHGYLLINGTDEGDSLLPQGVEEDFNVASVVLAAGDTVEAVAGVGTDNVYYNDESAFTLTIIPITVATIPPPPPPPSAWTYDARTQFSTTQNPGTYWRYGWSTALAGPVTTYPNYFLSPGAGAEEWTDNSIVQDNCPHVSYYANTVPYEYLPPQSMNIQAGPENQFSHCVWTAPTSGTYNIGASFTALDYGEPHGYILKNGQTIGNSLLPLDAEEDFVFNSMVLKAGDTIDLVAGVGYDGNYYNDESAFTFGIDAVDTGTNSQSSNGLVVPGGYGGIFQPIAGSGIAGGALTLEVNQHAAFSGLLDWGGARLSLTGSFTAAGTYSQIFHVAGQPLIDLALKFDTSGNLSGIVTQNDTSYSFTGGLDSPAGHIAGYYTFVIAPGASATGTPAGNGIGYATVSPAGMVSVVGQLADGKPLSASAPVTSGTVVNLYADPYGNPGGGISGTLTFANVPSLSDCSGTLSWTRPPDKSASYYHGGFSTSVTFTADTFNPVIPGLNGDTVYITATGADLLGGRTYSVNVHSGGGFAPYSGFAPGIMLSISPLFFDSFSGSLLDSKTGKWVPFNGLLQPKSRTGGALLFSAGQSGAVDIRY